MQPNLYAVFTAVMTVITAALLTPPAAAQERVLAFSVTGGASVSPSYFGAANRKTAPTASFGFNGMRFGALQFGDPDGPTQFAPGSGLRGAFRYIAKREGTDNLDGMKDVDAAIELGVGLHHTNDWWQVYGDLRFGIVGHKGFAGELGGNLIYRGETGLVLHAGPRVEFGNARFARTYFGVTTDEATASDSIFSRYAPGGGVHSVGVELGAYQPLNADWGVTGTLRYDLLRGVAADSPIVKQGQRPQISAQMGLTRHFNLRF